jgi:hypothetical protein
VSKLKELEKRLKAEPQNFGLRVQVAGLMREAGRSTEAVELYRSVALAYRDQGRTQQAIAVCRSILEIAPDDVACNALLSTLTTGSKPSIPSLTPPPSAGPRAASPTQPSVPRAPTRPSQPLPSRTGTGPLAHGSEPRGRAVTSRTGSQPPRTGSYPPGRPAVVMIPPKTSSQPPRAVTDSGTPGPAPSRPATEPAPPSAVTGRLPLEPPARSSPPTTPPVLSPSRWSSRDSISQGVPKRRSSMEETPLPHPLPHHIHDPTARNRRVDPDELETNPRQRQVERRSKELKKDEDLARELDTRPHRRIKSDELQKIDKPPPTIELAKILDDEGEPTKTQESPPHHASEEELTTPRDLLDLDPDTEG